MQYIERGMVADLTPFRRILFLFLLALSSMLVLMLAGYLIAMLVFDDFQVLFTQMNELEDARAMMLMKFFQIINQIGLFIIPPVLFAWLASADLGRYLLLKRRPAFIVVALSVIMVFAVLPLMHWSASINELLHFPEWLKNLEVWMRNSEDNAARITEAFLNVNSISGFFINILMIAVLPAIGEELLFRGVLQRLLHEWFKNVHLAILISAILFSALHLQFFGFLPRTILGVMFGYLFVITKSLWVPVVGHFINNGAAVIAAFLFQRQFIRSDYDELGNVTHPVWVAFSLVIVVILFLLIRKLSGSHKINGLHPTE